jgi:hypothetical protein
VVAPSENRGLTEAEKRKIVDEERFRLDVRKQFDPPAARSRALAFLNSPLGLLLASSVAITGVGALYTERQAALREKESRRQQIGRLFVEHDYRASQADYYVRDIIDRRSPTRGSSCTILWRIVAGDREYQPTAVEFRNLRWVGVVSQIGLIAGVPTEHVNSNLIALENYTFTRRCDDMAFDPRVVVQNLQCFTERARGTTGQEPRILPGCE